MEFNRMKPAGDEAQRRINILIYFFPILVPSNKSLLISPALLFFHKTLKEIEMRVCSSTPLNLFIYYLHIFIIISLR